MKLVMSKYTKEENAAVEETSSLITRKDRANQDETAKKVLELSSALLQSEVLSKATEGL